MSLLIHHLLYKNQIRFDLAIKFSIYQFKNINKMGKGTNRRSAKNGTKVSATKRINSSTPGRPKPMTTKAGYTHNRRRYEKGGEWCW